MTIHLTEAERDSLTECECGHFANEHSSEGCLATDFSEDWRPISDDDQCSCSHSPAAINRHAVERILATRLAARDAEWQVRIEALISDPDDVQWWEVLPYMDPPNDCETVEVPVIAEHRLRAILADMEEVARRG